MKESDWKVYKKIKEKAIEKFCSAVLDECGEVLGNFSESTHTRYLMLYDIIDGKNKYMGELFDRHSRSNAPLQLIAIRRAGLVDDGLLEKISPELQEQTNPNRLA
jgi:hypothetical protein